MLDGVKCSIPAPVHHLSPMHAQSHILGDQSETRQLQVWQGVSVCVCVFKSTLCRWLESKYTAFQGIMKMCYTVDKIFYRGLGGRYFRLYEPCGLTVTQLDQCNVYIIHKCIGGGNLCSNITYLPKQVVCAIWPWGQ